MNQKYDVSVTYNPYRKFEKKEINRNQFLPANSEEEYNIGGKNQSDMILNSYLLRTKKKSKNNTIRIKNILEYGCGDCRVARFIAKECENITCVDVSPFVLEAAKEKMDEHNNENVTYILADDFVEENKYDLIYSLQVLQHCPFDDQIKIVENIKKALTKSGWALIHLPKAECHPDYVNLSTCMRFTKEIVLELASYFSKYEFDERTLDNKNDDYYLWVQK